MYLAIYDDSKAPPAQKIKAGCELFKARYGCEATVVLVNIDEVCHVPGVEVRSSPYVRRSNYHVGLVGPTLGEVEGTVGMVYVPGDPCPRCSDTQTIVVSNGFAGALETSCPLCAATFKTI